MALNAGDWIAIYAAGVGTASLVWQALTRRNETQPQVRLNRPRIENRPAIVVGGRRGNDRVWDYFLVEVVNTGAVTVTVDAVQVERPLPHAARFAELSLTGQQEATLQPGGRATYTTAMSDLEDDEADRSDPIRVHVSLASGDSFATGEFRLAWDRATGPPQPTLKRLKA